MEMRMRRKKMGKPAGVMTTKTQKTITIHKHTQTVQINKLFQSRHFAALRDCDSCILIQID